MPEPVLFDRYRLIEPAGRGGSAEVWRARDEETGEEVAVKRLHPVVFADETGRRRLRREFDALRALDEPHIVKVRDLQVGDREAGLVLDFVSGESLAQRLARQAAEGRPMTPLETVAIVDDIAAALGAAHAA
ncbi:MAG TPA: protein kinase, partial [Candidatus Acidoferrum sp.]|nr:protein kinase [Candidatus Acidoferrum sp.]